MERIKLTTTNQVIDLWKYEINDLIREIDEDACYLAVAYRDKYPGYNRVLALCNDAIILH